MTVEVVLVGWEQVLEWRWLTAEHLSLHSPHTEPAPMLQHTSAINIHSLFCTFFHSFVTYLTTDCMENLMQQQADSAISSFICDLMN